MDPAMDHGWQWLIVDCPTNIPLLVVPHMAWATNDVDGAIGIID